MPEPKKKTVLVFCATEQAETEHTLHIDHAGEIVLTCPCERFLKFPKGTTADELRGYIDTHKEQNEGQLTVAVIEKQEEELLKGLQ